MEKYKISAEEFDKVSIKRIATNPGARSEYGESSMRGEDLKARMDKPLELFREKLNAFISFIEGNSEGDSLAKRIPTGINERHTLSDMISDVVSASAEFASYLSVGEHSLLEELAKIDEKLKQHDAYTKETTATVQAALEGLDVQLENTEAELIGKIAAALASAKKYADESKVGKAGDQTIDGALSISGDLLVKGETFAKQIESLEVGDAVIIANADGVLLSELSGYVIRVNGAAAYAIVYDPIDDCVKIGLGVYDSDTKAFTFAEGEAQVLATRGVITDGNIPVWNDEKKTFEDSKLSAEELASVKLYTSERGENLEFASDGVLYDNIGISGKAQSVTIADDTLPYGAIAMIGGASYYTREKNLIPVPYALGSYTVPYNGVLRTVYDDYSFVLNGTPTKRFYPIFITRDMGWKPPADGGIYYFSGCPKGGGNSTYYFELAVFHSSGQKVKSYCDYGDGCVCDFEWIKYTDGVEHYDMVLTLNILTLEKLDNTLFKPQLERGNIGTEFESVLKHTKVTKVTVSNEQTGKKHTYTIPTDLINHVDKLGYGVGGDVFNYVDFDKQKFVVEVVAHEGESTAHDPSIVVMSGANNFLMKRAMTTEVGIDDYLIDGKNVIPISQGDVITFEDENGIVPVPVPYRITYKVKAISESQKEVLDTFLSLSPEQVEVLKKFLSLDVEQLEKLYKYVTLLT